MKILITTEWYKPVINGVVTSICNLEEELTGMGHEVRILTFSSIRKFAKKGHVYVLPAISMEMIYPGVRVSLHMDREAIREICDWKPDVIHSQCEFSSFRYARSIADKTGAPIVHTYHTVYEDYTHYFSPSKVWGRSLVSWLSRRVCRQVSEVIVPTEKVANLLKGYHVKESIHTIPTGISLGKFRTPCESDKIRQEKSRLGIPPTDFVCLFVGRMAKEKNCEELLEFFDRSGISNCSLLMVGGGPYLEELKETAGQLKQRDKIFFTGMIEPENIGFYYKMGDVFVCASSSETQGITYIEALASGLPVLCRKDDCIRGIVENGINGYQYEDYRDFYRVLLQMQYNCEQVQKMQKNARKSSEAFDSKRFAESIVQVYQECTI